MVWSRRSRSRLNSHDLKYFPTDSLLDRIGQTLCMGSRLPRKELFESWEVAKRVARHIKGGPIYDLAGGHGLLGWLVLVQDRSTPSVTCVDRVVPPMASLVDERMAASWPQLADRFHRVQGDLRDVHPEPDARVLGVHACGGLTDEVIDIGIRSRAGIAVLPCCHAYGKNDHGGLSGWLEPSVAIDVTRVVRLQQAHYRVQTLTIPEDITPKNRLIIATPVAEARH